MVLCLIPQVLGLLKMKCSLSKRPGCFLIKVRWHDFAFSSMYSEAVCFVFFLIPFRYLSVHSGLYGYDDDKSWP